MSTRILVAEDDEMQARLIRVYLEREGHTVQTVHDGRTALERARTGWPELIVLDVMMPEISGLDVCRILRAEASRTPVLMLTAQSTENDLLLGLDLGADDYLTKPYSPRELTARIRALLRRTQQPAAAKPTVLTVGGLHIDTARFEVRIAGSPVALTAKEFGILAVLAAAPGRVFTRPEIIDKVFDLGREVVARTVDVHVMNLRRKLQQTPADPGCMVETVYGRGYRLTEPAGGEW
ncbi:response regulator transcription factor [Streptomyces sp. NBC_00233]|uniref:response regulator transcription factor n=1 Tax=Streptomyces sp. NBC_00233 TaxID=2975686 RepID=UPI002258562D|nr:response regulator transcription factor [Streptomyces sp. NBC_00233]MCX5233347.1 response regulator transcription factor [Streptomyces sp. NBC_00233]